MHCKPTEHAESLKNHKTSIKRDMSCMYNGHYTNQKTSSIKQLI